MNRSPATYQVLTPEFCLGDVIGEVSRIGGQLYGLSKCQTEFLVSASVPQPNIAAFEKWLTSASRGEGKIFVTVETTDA